MSTQDEAVLASQEQLDLDGSGSSNDPKIEDSVYGFVASTPKFKNPKGGVPRLFFMAGQERYTHESDGTFTKQKTRFFRVVAFRGAAVHAKDKLLKRQLFIAQGELEKYFDEKTGKESTRFIAKRFGPDLARTRRVPDESPHRNELERDGAERESTPFELAERAGNGSSRAAVGM